MRDLLQLFTDVLALLLAWGVHGNVAPPVSVMIEVYPRNPAYNPFVDAQPLRLWDDPSPDALPEIDPRWAVLEDADVVVRGVHLPFIDSLGCYRGRLPGRGLVTDRQRDTVRITHPQFHPKEEYIYGLGPLMERRYSFQMTSLGDLPIWSHGQCAYIDDPRRYQVPASDNDAGQRMPVRIQGCIVGRCLPGAEGKFNTFLQANHIGCSNLNSSMYYFELSPVKGEAASAFYQRILPLLRKEPWVISAGPYFYGYPDGFVYLSGKVELYPAKPAEQVAFQELLKADPDIVHFEPSKTIGFTWVVQLPDSMGLDITRWADRWMKSGAVQKADVLMEGASFGDALKD